MGVTKEKLYSHYLPFIGSASAVVFSANIMYPAGFKSVFDPFHIAVANALWFNSHIGIGTYLYTRRHMRTDSEMKKIGYCVFGSVMFNFGSLLLLATAKNIISDSDVVRLIFGACASAGLVCAGKKYLELIDENVSE